MTGPARGRAVRPGISLAAGLLATLALVVWAYADPGAALHGWLIGFAAVGCVPLGAVALLATHSLTGGRWGDAARPALVAAAAAMPLILIAAVPLVLFGPDLYPWAANPAAAGPGVARWYLNTGFFAVRSLAILALLSVAAFAVRRGPLPSLAAGLVLLVYCAGMNLLAFDWLLSLDPRFNASAFGVQIIVTQFAAALCVVILGSDAPNGDPSWGDVGALLLACLLGLAYLVFMTFLIDWYGDLPDQAAWFLRRSRHGWLAIEIAGAGLILSAAAGLMLGRVRHDPAGLRVVAGLTLAGVVGQMIWLVAPEAGGAAVATGLLGLIAVGGLAAGLAPRLARPRSDRRLAHGR